MAFFIDTIFAAPTIDAIRDALAQEGLFEDGAKTASGAAKAVKSNLQARKGDAVVKRASDMVRETLEQNSDFQAAALPAKFARITFSRYTAGMSYGTHVDNAFINGVRTDLSFTLFLSDPDSYRGGELIIKRHDGDEAVKLPSGALYLYPSDTLHSVAPVEEGERLAAVGWVQSRVRLEEHRAVLFDLDRTLRQLPKTEDAEPLRLNLLRVRNSLLRLWAD